MRNALIAVTMLAAMAVAAPAAEATYPGENGKILLQRFNGCFDRAIYTIDSDGTDETRISPPGSIDSDPQWSPDGQRIAFVSPPPGGSCLDQHVWTMNADGTGRTQLTFSSDVGSPTWSPDGSEIAFVRDGPPGPCDERDSHIWTMNADGSAQTQVTSGAGNVGELQWSPDGEWISFAHSLVLWDPDNDCENMSMGGGIARLHVPTGTGGPIDSGLRQLDWSPDSRKFAGIVGDVGDVYVARAPSGTFFDEDRITATPSVSESGPTWSPDGTKLAYNAGGAVGAVIVGNADGSGATQIATGAGVVDWQPVHTPSTYIRPKGATPMYLSLVPAFQSCSAPNRTHGPPLAFSSCNPPVTESPDLLVSAGDARLRSIGSLRIKVLPGPPGGADDTDVELNFSLTNVMNASDLSEYSGGLRAKIGIRVTDRGPIVPGVSSTTTDFPLAWTVPCSATPDPDVASHCALVTTIDAVIPGGAAEGTRAIWATEPLKVYDPGPDGRLDLEDDNSLFVTQGIFVP